MSRISNDIILDALKLEFVCAVCDIVVSAGNVNIKSYIKLTAKLVNIPEI